MVAEDLKALLANKAWRDEHLKEPVFSQEEYELLEGWPESDEVAKDGY